jgi:hypothetical protein
MRGVEKKGRGKRWDRMKDEVRREGNAEREKGVAFIPAWE